MCSFFERFLIDDFADFLVPDSSPTAAP